LASRHWFIHPSRALAALETIQDLLHSADQHLNNGKPENAVPICQAVIEKVVPSFNTIDDSNGLLSPLVSKAFEVMEAVANLPPSEPLRSSLFEYCAKSALKKSYQGWDTPWQFANLTAQLAIADEESRLEKMVSHLTRRGGGGAWHNNMAAEQAAGVMLRFHSRVKPEEFVQQFIAGQLQFPSIRQHAIALAVRNRDLDRAFRLAEEGTLQASENRHHGFVTTFLETQREILASLGKRSEEIAVAEKLFRLARHDVKYYHVLKEIMDPGEWTRRRPAFLEKIFREGDLRSLASIYAAEGELDMLMATLEKDGQMYLLREHESLLMPQYAPRLLRLRFRILSGELEARPTRATYKFVAKELRKMRKHHQPEALEDYIGIIQAQYRSRPALIEELRDAGF